MRHERGRLSGPSLVLGAALVLGPACEAANTRPPRDPPTHAALASATSEDCARCHADITREWRGSGHAAAWTDPLVAREYHEDPDPSCVACHAPLAEPGRAPSGRAAHDGVDCSTCHVDGDELVPRPSLAQAEACGACHQFRFLAPDDPDALAYDPQGWLQDTLGEWSRSAAAAAGLGCRDCHMPWIGAGPQRHRSHAFPGMRDQALVSSAVEVEVAARRVGGTVFVEARIDAVPGALGHAFPTGDLFRQGVLRVWTEEPSPDRDTYLLERVFAATPRAADGSGGILVEVADTRVPPPGSGPSPRLDFRLRSPAARTLGWSLELRSRAAVELEPATVVASGSVKIVTAPADRRVARD